MAATMADFTAKMAKLSTAEIIDQIGKTWNSEFGGIFREAGFEILEDRLGEEESDRIYAEIWNSNN